MKATLTLLAAALSTQVNAQSCKRQTGTDTVTDTFYTATISLPIYVTSTAYQAETIYDAVYQTDPNNVVTEVYRVREPASSTVTVPVTQRDFTAVSCERPYQVPTVTYTTTTTVTDPESYSTKTVTKTTTNRASTSTVSQYVITATVTSLYTYVSPKTVTTTFTTSSAVYTQYAACGPNNIVSKFPNGGVVRDVIVKQGVNNTWVNATDAVDCCNKCQALRGPAGCAFSAWNTLPEQLPYQRPSPCELYLAVEGGNNPQTTRCDASTAKGELFAGMDDGSGILFTVSNGPCGQVVP